MSARWRKYRTSTSASTGGQSTVPARNSCVACESNRGSRMRWLACCVHSDSSAIATDQSSSGSAPAADRPTSSAYQSVISLAADG